MPELCGLSAYPELIGRHHCINNNNQRKNELRHYGLVLINFSIELNKRSRPWFQVDSRHFKLEAIQQRFNFFECLKQILISLFKTWTSPQVNRICFQKFNKMSKPEQVLIINPANELTFNGKIRVIFIHYLSMLLVKKHIFTW